MPETSTRGDGANGGEMQPHRAGKTKRKDQPQLWDDLRFRHRVQEATRERGLALSDVMRAVGLPQDYTYRAADGRNTNVIMRLSEFLGVSPGELSGWVPTPEAARHEEAPPEDSVIRGPRLEPLSWSSWMLRATFVALAMERGDSLEKIANAVGIQNTNAPDPPDDRPLGDSK